MVGLQGFFVPFCFFKICFEHAEELILLPFSSRLAKIKEWVDAHDPGAMVIPVSGAIESKLLDMDEEERNKYCEEQKTQRWDRSTDVKKNIPSSSRKK